ncbi:hypothetical protein [Staphylococcus aureus]
MFLTSNGPETVFNSVSGIWKFIFGSCSILITKHITLNYHLNIRL